MQSLLMGDLALNRRSALAGLGGLSLAGALAGPTSVAADALADPVLAFGKIWAGYDAPMIGAFHGVMYLRAGDKQAVPVFGFAGIGVNQVRMTPVGLYMKARETGYFIDLASGEVLEFWDNPFTGERSRSTTSTTTCWPHEGRAASDHVVEQQDSP